MFHPVDQSECSHSLSGASDRPQEIPDCYDDDVALKQRKKLKTKVEDVDLKTKSTNKPSLHKTESAAAASPCNIRRAITAADLNIQLRYEIGRFPSHKPVFSRQNNYTPGKVVLGTKDALDKLLTTSPGLSEKSGVIIDEALYQVIKAKGIHVEKQIGSGSFGTVFHCTNSITGKPFVIKQVTKKFHRKEVDVLMQLGHPNITKILGFLLTNGMPEILMEYAGHSLKKHVELDNSEKILSEENINKLAFQGFEALSYMHNFDIWHLDIKPENVCITGAPLTLKFTDFGSSMTPQEPVTCLGWTPEYMSPEACQIAIMEKMSPLLKRNLQSVSLSGKSDVFAFGLTVGYMLCRQHIVQQIILKYLIPEDQKTEAAYNEVRTQIILYSFQDVNFIKKLAVDNLLSEFMKHFMNHVLEGDCELRWTSATARDYFGAKMEERVSSLPNIPSDLPALVCSSLSSQLQSPVVSSRPAQDMSAGKSVKKRLMMKIKRQRSAQPYLIPERELPPSQNQAALPDFNQLF